MGGDRIDLDGRWMIRPEGSERWSPIEVPGAWQVALGTGFHGVAEMRRQVTLAPHATGRRPERRWWLRFDAVATDLRARVNGVEVGGHRGDFVPFQLEVTDVVGDGGGDLDVLLRIDECRAEPPAAPEGLQNGHITKGFHDVISLQHGGVWQPVRLVSTGDACAIPNGVAVQGDEHGRAAVTVELEPRRSGGAGRVEVSLRDPGGRAVASCAGPLEPGASCWRTELRVDEPLLWSPDSPALYAAEVTLHDADGPSERHELRFGFRTARASGRHLLLNGRPLMVRGVLDWGHERRLVAPAPDAATVRQVFARLRAMGFNCVCLCMWYPPPHMLEIADETGMLIWQEHPVWQSPMRDEDLDEYRRLYRAFLRIDRRHPSVVIVSGTCEHPCFHEHLAEWWWTTARDELPDTVLELQTASFRWTDPRRSDLHDEHTYDNCNRWVDYLQDVRDHIAELPGPTRPFVMGETALFTSWPDLAGLRAAAGDERPWWLPRGFASMDELERRLRVEHGPEAIDMLRRRGDRFHLLGRKFQVERFRDHDGNAGLVMNHLRDVPQCQCGFIDDLDRWRFDPAQCRPWLGETALLLWTPDHRRGFAAGGATTLPCRVAISNFGHDAVDGPVELDLAGTNGARGRVVTSPLRCEPGTIAAVAADLPVPPVERPTRLTVTARCEALEPNAWDLWLFPAAAPTAPTGVYRLAGLPFAPANAGPDEVERGYSRGFGLPVRRWHCVLPDPAVLAPHLPAWDAGTAMPLDARVLLTHRLTRQVIDWLAGGGRVLLLASKAPGGLGTEYAWLFGAVPLVVEHGPLEPGDADWVVDLLGYDLVRRYARVIPSETQGIAEQVDPIIRLLYTHDQQRVVALDQVFATRVGAGLLAVSSLDHSEAPGRWLLERLLDWMARPEADALREMDADRLRPV